MLKTIDHNVYPGSTTVCIPRVHVFNDTLKTAGAHNVYPVVYTLWVSAVFSVCVSMVHVFNDKL